MLAREIMTTQVFTIPPETPVRDVARVLIEHGVSAVPVVGAHGEVIGMVSEGDLTGHSEMRNVERRDKWLTMLAEGELLSAEFMSNLQSQGRTARDIMSSPVITATEETTLAEIAHIFTEYHIKRVPVVRDNRIVGIVSRADLVKAFANPDVTLIGAALPKHKENFISRAFVSLEQHLHTNNKPLVPEDVPAPLPPVNPDAKLTVSDFKRLVKHFQQEKHIEQLEAQRKTIEQHRQQVQELVTHHVDEGGWQAMLHAARQAAEQGQKEYMLLRFPNELCSDGGRAINVAEEGWQDTLYGEAAEIYMRWKHDLKPQGFRLVARTLEYPGGFPGDIGLFLVWEY